MKDSLLKLCWHHLSVNKLFQILPNCHLSNEAVVLIHSIVEFKQEIFIFYKTFEFQSTWLQHFVVNMEIKQRGK